MFHLPFLSLVTISSTKPTGVGRVNSSYQEPVFKDFDRPFLEDYNRKEEEQCDSEIKNENVGWCTKPLVSSAWSSYHYIVGPKLH